MEEITLTILSVMFYIVLVTFYAGLLYFTKKKAEILNQKQYHYIFNLVSLVILFISMVTPISMWGGYAIACIVLIVELLVNGVLGKN